MRKFYAFLHEQEFIPLVRGMQRLVDKTSLKGLPAGRIVDTLLMTRGGLRDDTAPASEFLKLPPRDIRLTVQQLGTELQDAFGKERLLAANLQTGK
jgi:hypothetical protein